MRYDLAEKLRFVEILRKVWIPDASVDEQAKDNITEREMASQ